MEDITRGARRPVSDRTLWFVLGTGTLVWAVHFFAMYVMVDHTCRRGSFSGSVLGISGIQAATLAITAAGVAVIGAAGWVGYRRWRRLNSDLAPEDDRTRFLLFSGMVLNMMYIALMILTFAPAFVVPPCR